MKKTLLCSALLASFGFAAQAQTITNAGLETWRDYKVAKDLINPDSVALQAPEAWVGIDSLITGLTGMAKYVGIIIKPVQQVFKSEKAHTGTYAAQLKSADLGDTLGVLPGVLLNSAVEISLDDMQGADPSNVLDLVKFTGGTPVNAKVDTVKAWILLEDSNEDDALINVSLLKKVGDSSVVVGGGTFVIKPEYNEYTEVAVPITYTSEDVPERLVVSFVSSNIQGDTAHVGNTLYVDDVSFTYQGDGTSIEQPLLSENPMLVYPNPAREQMYFNLNANAKAEDFELVIFDIAGKEISREVLQQQVNIKNVADWTRGNYFYTLSNSRTGTAQQGKFVLK